MLLTKDNVMFSRSQREIIKSWSPAGKPLVTVVCITYNHEQYISNAIDGFLMQETDFPFEIIIHDDASTDKTAEIIKEYERNYPEIIRPVYQTENQYSKKVRLWLDITFPLARGKYIALCEGDDYWSDPYKLQKQVHFLEARPDYELCVGGFTRLVQSTREMKDIIKSPKNKDPGMNGFTFSLNDMANGWITKTLTAVIRKNVLDKIDFSVYKHTRDIHLFYHMVKDSRAFYFMEIFGVYRVHSGGVNSMKQGRVNSNAAYNCYKELYEQNRDEFTRIMNRFHTLGLLNYNLYNKYPGNNWKSNITLFFESVKLTRRLTELKYLFTVLIPSDIKKKLRDRSLS